MTKRKLEEDVFQETKKQKNEDEESTTFNRPITYKIKSTGIDTPNFYSSCYCVKPSTTDNIITIKVEDINQAFENPTGVFYLCNIHQLSLMGVQNCEYCTPFLRFKYAFVVHTSYAFYIFPPPTLFVPKSINYFKTFLRHATTIATLKTQAAKEKYMNKEFNYYSAFMNMSFQGGSLKDISAGKRSYVRNKILGFQSKGIRATLTIDSTLGPHYGSLPQKIFDSINFATPLMIVNRAPSIKHTCLYVLEMGRNLQEDDYTIHINPFLTEGLHADQDGDELSVFFLENQSELPSIDMEMAITELKRLSWKYGSRHCVGFRCRYQFTQYHKYILQKYDSYFCKHNALWASLKGSPKIKGYKMLELGCSTHFDEIDEFITLLIDFTTNLPTLVTSTHDILSGVGDIQHVVDSGAKGSNDHIIEYKKNLYNDNPDNIQNLIDGFNKNIKNSSRLGKEGGRQFCLLHAVNPLSLHRSSIYYNDSILLKDVKKSTSMATFYYNKTAVTETFNSIINDNSDLNMTKEQYTKLLNEYL